MRHSRRMSPPNIVSVRRRPLHRNQYFHRGHQRKCRFAGGIRHHRGIRFRVSRIGGGYSRRHVFYRCHTGHCVRSAVSLPQQTRDLAGNLHAVGRSGCSRFPTPPAGLSALSISSITGDVRCRHVDNRRAYRRPVEYGLTTSYGTLTSIIHPTLTSHTITLTGLLPNTTYYVRARSQDAASNLGLSAGSSLKTLGIRSLRCSHLFSVTIPAIHPHALRTTNKASNSQVEYDSSGSVPPYAASSTIDSAMVTSQHNVAGPCIRMPRTTIAHDLSMHQTTSVTRQTPFSLCRIPPADHRRNQCAVSVSDTSQVSTGPPMKVPIPGGIRDHCRLRYHLARPRCRSTTRTSFTGLQGNTLYHYRIKSRRCRKPVGFPPIRHSLPVTARRLQFSPSMPATLPPVRRWWGVVTDESSDSRGGIRHHSLHSGWLPRCRPHRRPFTA